MKLILVNNTDQEIAPTLFEDLLKVAPKSPHSQVELLLTNNAEIQKLNKQYRGKDYATDVLSFPMDEDNLGQIVISLDKAQEQANELGQSFTEELRFLFTHGLLHLHGHDHENPEDEAAMLKEAYRMLGR